MWAFVALATLELLGVHLFVSLKWPWLAWPMTALTLLSIIGFVRLILSFRTCPHELSGERLRLRIGRLRSLDVSVGNIAGIGPVTSSMEMKATGTVKLSLLSYPNRIIELIEPVRIWRRPAQRIALALDDPAAFDLALQR